jgi:hypothetical protein
VNLGGDFNPGTRQVDYGWPWVYGSETTISFFERQTIAFTPPNMKPVSWFRVDLIEQCNVGILTLNSICCLGIVILVSAVWQWRLRRRRKLWQFTIADWFAGCLLFAVVYTSFTGLYSDQIAGDKLRGSLLKNNISITIDYPSPWLHDPDEYAFDNPIDVPQDWFWHTLFASSESHPRHLINYSIILKRMSPDDRAELPAKAVQALHQFSHLQHSSFRFDSIEFPPGTWPFFTKRMHCFQFAVKHAATFCDDTLGRNQDLKILDVSHAPKFRGHRLTDFPNLEVLRLEQTGLDAVGYEHIGHLTQLKQLYLIDQHDITDQSWQHFANWQQLEEFQFSDELPISANSLAMLQRLPKLKRIRIVLHKFDSQWLQPLEALPLATREYIFRGQAPEQQLTFTLAPGEPLPEQAQERIRQRYREWEAAEQ